MINLFITILLAHCIGALVFKSKNSNAYCGLFGYLGSKCNLDKLTILGMFNDTRGGDSCGLFIDSIGSFKSDKNKNKLYRDFIAEESPYGAINKEYDAILGHCRKASVGGIGARQAQPCIVLDENDKYIDFCMIHNGTLTNYKDLIKKYDVVVDDADTDSQQFCKLVYQEGFKVLSEYTGAGAFVFYDYRDGTIHVFKGKSKAYANDDSKEERPLYTYKMNGGIYFSSMFDSLYAIGAEAKEVIDLKCNVLYKYNKDKNALIEKEAINRENNVASRLYNNTITRCYTQDYDYDYNYNTRSSQHTNTWINCASLLDVAPPKTLYETFISVNEDLRFFNKSGIIHGEKSISDYGNMDLSTTSAMSTGKYWFFNGYLTKGLVAYTALEVAKRELFNNEDVPIEFMAVFLHYPIRNKSNDTWYKSVKINELNKYTGVIDCPFGLLGKKKYRITSGTISGYMEYSSSALRYSLVQTGKNYQILDKYKSILSKCEEEESNDYKTAFALQIIKNLL